MARSRTPHVKKRTDMFSETDVGIRENEVIAQVSRALARKGKNDTAKRYQAGYSKFSQQLTNRGCTLQQFSILSKRVFLSA